MSQWTTLKAGTPSSSSAYSDLPPSDIDDDTEEQLFDDASSTPNASQKAPSTSNHYQGLSKRSQAPTLSATQESPRKRLKLSQDLCSSNRAHTQPKRKPSPPSFPSASRNTRRTSPSSASDSDDDMPSVEMLLASRSATQSSQAGLSQSASHCKQGKSFVLELTGSPEPSRLAKGAKTLEDTGSDIEFTDDESDKGTPIPTHPSPTFLDLTLDSDEEFPPAPLVAIPKSHMRLPTPPLETSDDEVEFPATVPIHRQHPRPKSSNKIRPFGNGLATLPTPPRSTTSSEDLQARTETPYVLSIHRWLARAYSVRPRPTKL